jgi:hypothetical protein
LKEITPVSFHIPGGFMEMLRGLRYPAPVKLMWAVPIALFTAEQDGKR